MVQTSISAWLTKPKLSHHNHIRSKEDPAPSSLQHQKPMTSNLNTKAIELSDRDEETSNLGVKNFRLNPLPLPPNVSLSPIISEHIGAYMRMTALLLPIPYPKKFFEETIEDAVTSSICLIALWAEPAGDILKQKVVSGIRCRLLAPSLSLPLPQARSQEDVSDEAPSLYIAALTTLAPYRGHGLASALFHCVLSRAIRQYGITTVTAHRWEANEDARGWYVSHGFNEVGFAHDYYRRLKPSGAFLLERKIGPKDLLGEDEEANAKLA